MAEENLEKKVRKGRWYHYAGAVAATAFFVGTAVCLHRHGNDESYKKGRKATCIEERNAGLEEGRRMCLNENPSFGWFEGDEIYASFTRNIPDVGKVTYRLSLNGIPGTGERAIIEQPDGSAVYYVDADLEMEAYGGIRYSIGRHDGAVDMITISGEEYPRILFRYRDYAENKEEFDDADETLGIIKDFFRERH